MAVTPLLAGFRLQILYTSDLTHKEQLLCDATLVSGTYELNQVSGTTTPTATFVAAYAALVKPFLATTSTIGSWVLQKYDSGAYVEVDTGSIGVVGTSGVATAPGSSFTWTFLDGDRKHVKTRQLGVASSFAGLTKIPQASLTGAGAAYANDLLDLADGHLGAVIRGRSDFPLTRGLNLVVGTNRKSGRRLGAV